VTAVARSPGAIWIGPGLFARLHVTPLSVVRRSEFSTVIGAVAFATSPTAWAPAGGSRPREGRTGAAGGSRAAVADRPGHPAVLATAGRTAAQCAITWQRRAVQERRQNPPSTRSASCAGSHGHSHEHSRHHPASLTWRQMTAAAVASSASSSGSRKSAWRGGAGRQGAPSDGRFATGRALVTAPPDAPGLAGRTDRPSCRYLST
jgi:hypothetical protein